MNSLGIGLTCWTSLRWFKLQTSFSSCSDASSAQTRTCAE